MRRIARIQQRKRQTWLALPASGIEEVGHGSRAERTIGKDCGEEEIRLHCMAGTRQALAELMAWSGIEEQGEAITLMIHHLHGLGPGGALPLLDPPRHVIEVSKNVSLAFHRKSLQMIQQDPGDEVFAPQRTGRAIPL